MWPVHALAPPGAGTRALHAGHACACWHSGLPAPVTGATSRPGLPDRADRLLLPLGAGIPSDHVLPDDPTCLPIIQRYAADQPLFFDHFAAAYVKMTNLGAAWV